MAIKLFEQTPDFNLEIKDLKKGPFLIFLVEFVRSSNFKILLTWPNTASVSTFLEVEILEDFRNRITFCDRGIGNYCYEFKLSEFRELRENITSKITGKCTEIGKPHHNYECVLSSFQKNM